MSDRLNELLHQRALLQEHLDWIEREIAEASGGAQPAAAPKPAPAPTPVRLQATLPTPVAAAPKSSYLASQAAQILSPPSPEKLAAESSVVTAADEILDQYRVAPDNLKTDVKKGCFLYFFGALALVGLGIVALYFLFQRGR